MRIFVRIAAATVLLPCSAAIAADSAMQGLSDAVDAVFANLDNESQPGCAVGVIHNGEYIHKAGYGMANLEHDIAISSASVFRTGSVSKQFTAMAIAILAERGELDLDADVHEYLPDLRDYGHKVTIRQMLHHLAGMGDYDPELFKKADGSEFRFGNEDYWTIGEFYDAVTRVPLILTPGEKWQYSNLGYFLLAQVVERVSGKTLREFAAVEIFGPLGMQASFFNDNVNQPVTQRADGYRLMDDGSFEIYMTNLDWVGDGGVYTNLDDFIKWDQNFYDNKLGKGGGDLINMVTTPHPNAAVNSRLIQDAHYAFGLQVGTLHGAPVIGHSGGWVAFSSVYQRFPELKLSVVVFCNSTGAAATALGSRVSEIAVAAIRDIE
ncbi:MAG: beta-lactamase family protein [Proteobacteria bacterium]|nr:beta-lactamase family protein [Pseudomonadota bacterium]